MFILLSCNGQELVAEKESEIEASSLGRIVDHLHETTLEIFQDSKGIYWFASDGLMSYDGKVLTHFTTEDGLAGNRVIGFREDHLGNLYFDTLDGVSKFDGKKFTTLEVKEGGEWKLEENDLWFVVGWQNKGPFRYDGEYLYALEFPACEQEEIYYQEVGETSHTPRAIYNIYEDHSGNIWFGTAALGACRFDGEKIEWIYEDEMTITPGGGALGIRATLEDQNGKFWFTNARYSFNFEKESEERNGVHYLNYKKLKGPAIYDGGEAEKDPYFMSIVEDKHGHLWMLTYGEGVWRYDGNEFINYPVSHNGSEVLLFSIFKDNKGELWLGTHNCGAMRFDGNEFVKFTP